MTMETKKVSCPRCDSKEVGMGKFTGYANLMPLDRLFTNGSEVLVELCTDCGHVIGLKVEKPEKFKKQK